LPVLSVPWGMHAQEMKTRLQHCLSLYASRKVPLRFQDDVSYEPSELLDFRIAFPRHALEAAAKSIGVEATPQGYIRRQNGLNVDPQVKPAIRQDPVRQIDINIAEAT